MFDIVSCAMMAKKTAKKFTALSEFLLCLFSYLHCCCGCAELASSLTMKKFWFLERGQSYGSSSRSLTSTMVWEVPTLLESCLLDLLVLFVCVGSS